MHADDLNETEAVVFVFIFKNTAVAETFFRLFRKIADNAHEIVTRTGMGYRKCSMYIIPFHDFRECFHHAFFDSIG